MAFTFDGIVFDRIQSAIAENSTGDLLYRLTQLSEASVETTSESKEAKDAQGILIKKTYKSKAVEFKATNAMLDLNIMGATTGSGKKVAATGSTIQMPMVLTSDVATSVTLPKAPVTGTLKVYGVNNTGSLITTTVYKMAASASDTEFAYASVTKVLTLPTNPIEEVAQFLIKYEYESDNGIMVDQRADKFPASCKLTLVALGYDPCTPDVLRKILVVFPNFNVSPDTTISFDSEATQEFSGSAAVNYCSPNKQLYYIVMSEDDIED